MAILSTSTLTFIDLNEISIGDEPNNPTNNQIWFDTSTNTVKKWNSLTTSWEVVNDYTEDIKDAIKNLNISGRNLLADTAYSKELSGTGGTNQTGCKYNLVNTITYEKDIKEKEITLAFDWEFTGSIAAGSFIAQTAGPLYTPLSEVINISSNNYYGTSVFTTILTDTESFSAVEIKASGVNGIIRVTHPRLFYGSKDLDWSPAPEDTAAQFETIFDRTAKGIYMSVSDLEANKKSLVDINNNAVVIKSDSINLEGLVTANNNFKVLLDGSIEAVNGKFSGIIQADTEITSPKISGGTINGTSLTVGDNFSVDGTTGKLTAKDGSFHGTIEADSDIQGATFTSKNGYFKVLADGTIESTGGKFTGNVTSNLAISGATITGSTIETKSKKFKVDNNGILTATEAKISGTITSSEISSTTIKAGNNNEFLVSTDGSVSASNLTISGGSINLGNNTFKVDNTGKVTASDVSITGGTLSIGDKFLVSNTGVLTAIDGNFKGNIQADSTITGASFASKNNTLTIDTDGNLVSEGTISLANGNFYVNDQGQLSLTGSINAGSSITGATITGGTIGTKNGNFYVNSDGILTAKGAIIEGDVRITSGSVPSSVLPNDIVNGAANGTSANEKIDNLQIGGRNLVKNSNFYDGKLTNWYDYSSSMVWVDASMKFNDHNSVKISSTEKTTDGWIGIRNKFIQNVKAGTTFAYSVWYYVEDKNTFDSDFTVEIKGQKVNTNNDVVANSTIITIDNLIQGEWTRVEDKVSLTDDWDYLYIYPFVRRNGIIWFTDVKVEEGNKCTDWTPAPEDVDSAITNVDNKFANYSTTTDMNSAITQKANEITSSVSNTYATKSTVNSLSDNLTKNYSTTSQMNSAINQKANEITSTVSNTYATKTTVNDLSNNLANNYSTTNQMNSAINQKANEITSTVSSTYTTKSDFNNLSIGGTNLLKNTKTLNTVYGKDQNKWAVSDTGTEGFKQLETSTTNTDWVECQIPLYTEYNGLRQNVTISFQYYEGVSELLVFSFSAHKADGSRVKEIANTVVKTTFKDLGLRDGWSYVSYTFDPTSVNFQSGADHYRVQFKKINGKTGKISIRKIKLEYGNKATDWTPAPEDIDNAITTVNNKFDNYSTTTEMNSAITQKAGEITSSVSSTYTTKTDFNNLQVGSKNLLRHSDFSKGVIDYYMATNEGTVSIVSYKVGNNSDDDKFIRDQNVLRISHDISTAITNSKTYTMCRLKENIKLKANTEYTMSVYIYLGDNCGQAYFSVWPILEDGSTGTRICSSDKITSYSGKFVKLVATFNSGAESTIYSIRYYNRYKTTLTEGESVIYIFNPMLVEGNKEMPWSIAPEDIEDYTNTIANNLNNTFNNNMDSAINKAKTDTLNEIANNYVDTATYTEFTNSVSSSFEQTSNDMEMKFTTATEQITRVGDNLEVYKEEVSTNIRFSDNGIEIGKSDSPFGVSISNEKMSFTENENEVAYISNSEMLITDANIKNSLRIGYYKFVPRANGNMSLVWDEGNNLLKSGSSWHTYATQTLTATKDDHYFYTDMTAYLTAGVNYKFTCETDGIWIVDDGNDTRGTDTVEAFLSDNKDGTQSGTTHVHLKSNSYIFSVPSTGTWYLRFDINKNGATHSFWNYRIVIA